MFMMKKLLAVIVLFGLSLPLFAGVNLKNGNFYISYLDIVVPGGGRKLEITRTYNSKSTENGWFGFGWGSLYETKLVPSPDGCVVIYEYGGGGKTRFCPKGSVDAKAAASKVVKAMRKKSTMSDREANKLIDRLKNNAELRHAYAKNFGIKPKLAKGTILYSNQRGIQNVEVTKDGYLRKSNDGKKEYFNKQGKLVKIKAKDGYTVEFKYKGTRVKSIKDSQAKQIHFEWYSNNKVKTLSIGSDRKAEFKYNGDDLVYSKDVNGVEHEYKYDKNHNLTAVIFNPSRKKGEKVDQMLMEYEPKTLFCSKVVERNGDSTKYEYKSNPKKPKDHYWTLVTKKGFNGKPVTNRYEYEIRTKSDGQRYTYRILTIINGIKTETIYSDIAALPIKIARGRHVTNFEYNKKGLLIKKSSSRGEFVKIEYNDRINKISKVTNNQGWTKYKYDKQANLVKAESSKGQKVLLVYNRKGKITKMVDVNEKTKKKRTLSFKYNSVGKPIEITMEKVGKINVAYDNFGEIKRVDSAAGHKMALQVTQAFQNLLSIVKPAGVNLSM